MHSFQGLSRPPGLITQLHGSIAKMNPRKLSWIQLVLIAVLLLAMFAMGYLFVTDVLLLFSPRASLYIYEPLYWVTMLFEAVATAYIALCIRFVIAWSSLLKN